LLALGSDAAKLHPSHESISTVSASTSANLSRLSAAQTRSISAENFTGAKGAGGMATEGNGAVYARDLGAAF